MNRPRILSLLLTTLTVLPFASAPGEERPPNILFILADDVGREVLGCYGGQSYDTPRIDALAREGMRFQHCYSMPVCHPTRVCFLSGRYPITLGNPRWGTFPEAEEEHTVASFLRQAGYATAVAGKWQLCLLKKDRQQPARMGFDEWSLFGWHEGPRYHDPMIYENGKVRGDTDGAYGPDLYTEFLIDFVGRNREQPFFAFYSMALCHDVTDDLDGTVPYGPDGRWLTYEEMVHDMDRQVGKLLDALGPLGLEESTVVIYTTDNGTAGASYLRYADGKFIRPEVVSKYRGELIPGGKGELTDWGTRVPLIVRWPGKVPAGEVVTDLVDFSDFLPTFADLAGATIPDDVSFDGLSFARRLRKGEPGLRRYAFAQGKGGGSNCFVRSQDWKYYRDGRLYDMKKDPNEQHPVEGQDGLRRDMRRAIAAIVARK